MVYYSCESISEKVHFAGNHVTPTQKAPGRRSAYTDWASVLGRLPSDGRYSAGLAMIETENGYYILIQNTVTQPAREPQDEDDEPEEPEKPEEQEKPEASYTEDGKGNYIVNTTEGLKQLFDEKNPDDFVDKTITLKAGATFTVDNLADTFKGTLTSDASNKATIEITGESLTQGLFDTIDGGTVENLKINVTADIIVNGGTVAVGAVAGKNKGTITGCEVTIESNIGASGNGNYTFVGGVVGYNLGTGTVSDCIVTIESGITIYAAGGALRGSGGVVGYNGGTMRDCTCSSSEGYPVIGGGNGMITSAGEGGQQSAAVIG